MTRPSSSGLPWPMPPKEDGTTQCWRSWIPPPSPPIRHLAMSLLNEPRTLTRLWIYRWQPSRFRIPQDHTTPIPDQRHKLATRFMRPLDRVGPSGLVTKTRQLRQRELRNQTGTMTTMTTNWTMQQYHNPPQLQQHTHCDYITRSQIPELNRPNTFDPRLPSMRLQHSH
jgi:hypothetical protein